MLLQTVTAAAMRLAEEAMGTNPLPTADAKICLYLRMTSHTALSILMSRSAT
jgi:hypothetical protein